MIRLSLFLLPLVAAAFNSSLYAAYVDEWEASGRKRALYSVQFEIDVHVLTNNERVAMGLQPLFANAKLISAARKHSEDMVVQNYFAHNSLDGRTPFQRMQNEGYSYSTAAENIAYVRAELFLSLFFHRPRLNIV